MDAKNPDLSGLTALVTGANSGIGFETCRALATYGARVWMVCRNPERCEAARDEIERTVPGADLQVALADFDDLDSVRAMAARFLETSEPLHILVNNAGGIYGKRELTGEGLERTWQVNLVAPFLLTELLAARLRESAPARIVNVTSDAYKQAKAIAWDDLSWEASKFKGFPAYAQAKLGVLLWTRELARRLDGTRVTANAVHPGGVRTNFGSEYGPLMRGAMWLVGPFLRGPIEGAETGVWLASAPEMGGKTGGYYANQGPGEVTPAAADDEAASRLWDMLEETVRPKG